MRFQYLSCLLATCVMGLAPMTQAGGLDGERSQYLNACKTSAMAHQASDAVAVKHCECSANVVDQKFTQKEIAQLNDGTAPAALVVRLKSEVQNGCSKAK
jgi:hypothetical protein